ncbi:hypothetical protein L6R49_29275 [Myxococcota bacterium]|nr:hypothetical protein [Myxococcota bacterium]
MRGELPPAERLALLLRPPGLRLPVNPAAAISALARRLRERETTARAAVALLESRIQRRLDGDAEVWTLAPIGQAGPLAVVVLPSGAELDDAQAEAEHAEALAELPRDGAEGLAPVGPWARGEALPSPELLARVLRGLTTP